MWIIKVALNRPYTFIVLAVLILIVAPVVIFRTPTDIFPNIDIPVISVAWTYTGLNPEELEGRLTTPYEKSLTALVDNIEHTESTTYNGMSVVKLFLQPNASLDTANAQVTAASQALLRNLPPGTQPPLIINFSASSVPILQLGVSGKGLSEDQLNDLSLNFLRTQLITVPGAVVPYPYGGKQRQMMINMNAGLLQSKSLSPQDLLTAVNLQSLVLPSGTAKIGPAEYDVRLNDSPRTVEELNELPVQHTNSSASASPPPVGTTIYLRDVANVADGFGPQTNIVRQDGRRGVLVTILKSGTASTLDVVSGIKKLIPRVAATLPPELRMEPLNDQSIFVRGAVTGVIREAVIAAALTGLMILLFLGSWRSYPDHRHLDSALDPVIGHRAGFPRRNHQHHDSGRTGAGGGRISRRRHGYHRKHRTLPRRGARSARSHPQRSRADRRSRAGFHAVHLYRLPAHVFPGRRCAVPVRAARGSGGLRDARFLHPFADAGSHPGDVSPQIEALRRAHAQPAGAVPARV
jgi:multidrug efflux pump subunit AcrB